MFRIGGPSAADRARQAVNEARISATIDKAVADYHAATAEPDIQPEIIEHPVDPAVQTGESALLGGEMEIRGDWGR